MKFIQKIAFSVVHPNSEMAKKFYKNYKLYKLPIGMRFSWDDKTVGAQVLLVWDQKHKLTILQQKIYLSPLVATQ